MSAVAHELHELENAMADPARADDLDRLVARFGRGGKSSREMMEYYWDTIEACIAPAQVVAARGA